MHQRSGIQNVIELHGSLWRMRCEFEGTIYEDLENGKYSNRFCDGGNFRRPDIIWFGDMLDENVIREANLTISTSDLFISIGTSALVWPAAGYPQLANNSGAFCIEVNPEDTELSPLYDLKVRTTASIGLKNLFRSKEYKFE